MKRLKPVSDKSVEYVSKCHIYVKITDYNNVSLLKQIKVKPGVVQWMWVSIDPKDVINLEYNKVYNTFDRAITRSVNDPFCNVIQFDDIDSFKENLVNIKYIDENITQYKGKNEEFV